MYDVPRGIIVSVQDTFSPGRFAEAVFKVGAVALRMQMADADLAELELSCKVDIPLIGLVKDKDRRITATEADVCLCQEGESDYVATGAVVYGTDIGKVLPNMIADIATLDQAILAEELGYCAVTTALSGYTVDYRCKEFEGPDINLVEDCVDHLSIPVIAEGRYFTTDQVRAAFDAGAHSVCIGAAITRPDLITKRFVNTVKFIEGDE